MNAMAEPKPGGAGSAKVEFSTAEKVAFLTKRNSYRHRPFVVTVEETHMSWVFLAGERVYKLKKPVTYAFLDFSTIARRENNCREEVRLNRRLAPDVYLGVVALTADDDGNLALGGPGAVVDWLVEMRRLPAEHMLDKLIAAGRVSVEAIDALADRLVAFYRACDRPALCGSEYLAQLTHEQDINREVITDPHLALDQEQVERVLADVRNYIDRSPEKLLQRVLSARIVEGHGDLRPEHICLADRALVIDCLEFNQRLRLVDPVDEITFLGLECARLGAEWIGSRILERYTAESGDQADAGLVDFYWAYRACLRARLSLLHILEGDKRKPEKWLPLAHRYLALANRPSIIRPVRESR